jgi:TonB family protein
MAETPDPGAVRANTSAGHLSVHVDGAHPAEVPFLFERQPRRLGLSFVASFLLDLGVVGFLILASRLGPSVAALPVVPPDPLNVNIVWLPEPGPGGGGGGGGNRMKEPPRKAEAPGKDKNTVPVVKAPALVAPQQAKNDPPPVEQLNIPAKALASDLDSLPGALTGPPGPPTLSQGSGSGGGAGTGNGSGIGSGLGSGLGPGSGGGTGGGVFRPGNGVTPPVALYVPKPQYTADAMRARIQGTVWVECVVQTNGACGEAHVVRSLDPTFGLDQEAIKAARLFKFKPGVRMGEPVAVLVTIELSFSLH